MANLTYFVGWRDFDWEFLLRDALAWAVVTGDDNERNRL
jgi:hypothetical protein